MVYETKPLLPVTALQRKLLSLIWSGFDPEDGWAAFASIGAKAREKGIADPANAIDELFPHYVMFDRFGSGGPMNQQEVGLTTRGLAQSGRKPARAAAQVAVEAIGYLAKQQLQYQPDRKQPQPLTVSSDEIRRALGLGPTERRSLFWVLANERSLGLLSPPMDAWKFTPRDEITQYRYVRDIPGFLAADRRRIRSLVALQRRDPFVQHIVGNESVPVVGISEHEGVTQLVEIKAHLGLEAAATVQRGPHPQKAGLIALNDVEARMRAITSIEGKATWQMLVAMIFERDDRVLPPALEAERQELGQLFRGVGLVLRNPIFHSRLELDRDTAGEAVAMASVLLRILDRVEDEIVRHQSDIQS